MSLSFLSASHHASITRPSEPCVCLRSAARRGAFPWPLGGACGARDTVRRRACRALCVVGRPWGNRQGAGRSPVAARPLRRRCCPPRIGSRVACRRLLKRSLSSPLSPTLPLASRATGRSEEAVREGQGGLRQEAMSHPHSPGDPGARAPAAQPHTRHSPHPTSPPPHIKQTKIRPLTPPRVPGATAARALAAGPSVLRCARVYHCDRTSASALKQRHHLNESGNQPQRVVLRALAF